MTAYSTHEVAELLAMRPAQIRALVRAGCVQPERTRGGHYRFSFQDLVLLRTAKGLAAANLGPGKVARALRALAEQLPSGRPLSAVRVHVEDSRVLVRDGAAAWEPETRQTVLDFAQREPRGRVAQLARRGVAQASPGANSAEEWFEVALEHEQAGASKEAESAYRNALLAHPEHVAARINLGRLRHAANAFKEAETLYREALHFEPRHPIAQFNLGVVLEDQGDNEGAIEAYEAATRIDPHPADVHYNLARLYEQLGNLRAALRHLGRFKALTRRGKD